MISKIHYLCHKILRTANEQDQYIRIDVLFKFIERNRLFPKE